MREAAKAREIVDGVVQVYLPLPMRPSIVNVYLVRAGRARSPDRGRGRDPAGRWAFAPGRVDARPHAGALLPAPAARARAVRRRPPPAEDHAARRSLAGRPREPARRLPRLAREGAESGCEARLPGARRGLRGPPPPGAAADRLPPRAQARHAGADPAPAAHRLRGGARRLP